jgi:hypothetical protein
MAGLAPPRVIRAAAAAAARRAGSGDVRGAVWWVREGERERVGCSLREEERASSGRREERDDVRNKV